MTTLPPDEALHFRGETLTPESPRPLHVAEPANIPVLENQMDPIFNDTSTYEKPESTQDQSLHKYHDDARLSYQPYAFSTNNAVDAREGGGGGGGGNPDSDQGQEPANMHTTVSLQEEISPSEKRNEAITTASAVVNNAQSAPTSDQPEWSSLQNATTDRQPFAASSSASSSSSSPGYRQQQQDGGDNAATASALTQIIPSDNPQDSSAASFNSGNHRTLGASATSEVDTTATAAWATPSTTQNRLENQKEEEANGDANKNGDDGVDLNNLLVNLSRPHEPESSAPTATAPSPVVDDSHVPQIPPNDLLHHKPSGLPPRPPPQEKLSIHPNYSPNDDIRSYHHLPSQTSSANNHHQSNYHAAQGSTYMAAAGAPGTASGANSLRPPPIASFQQSHPSSLESPEVSDQANYKNGRVDKQVGRTWKPDEDSPWGPEVQKKYDEFLSDERVYVTEGLWDRFPPGSRLFVGNLPTERVTKRDLFHIFHKYGKLAQISIKQAYGFIQFLAATSCYRALQVEQGAVVRGRKIHLEISKPQRNTRPGSIAADPPPRGLPPRRSRSPEFSRSGPSSRNARGPGDRPLEIGKLPLSDFRDDHPHLRRRDDYRPPRSPSPRLSPRPYRGRDDYRGSHRDRTPSERYDRRERRRSRSPYVRDRRYRSPSPRPRGTYESDLDLPVPRRLPRDVPDVQILVLEDVDRKFVFHVENSFRSRGLRVDILTLGPRIPLSAAVQRQVNEGVRAIVRLSRSNQFSGKISLQLIDRAGGPGNARFNDYPDLEIGIATEIVFHALSVQRGGAPAPFPLSSPFGIPPIPTVPISQPPLPALSTPPNIANLITSLDAPTLQSVLATLQQQQHMPITATQPPFPAAHVPHGADLANILNSVMRQPPPPMPHITAPPQHPHLPPQRLPLQPPNAPLVPDPNLLSLLAKGLGGQQPPNQAAIGHNVQNIMSQLARWKQ